MIDENRNNKVREAHAGQNESGESSERPESHFELAFRFPGAFQREGEADCCDHNSDGSEHTEDEEKSVVGQKMLLLCW